ncbi:MAG: PIN domain-containing protein [Crocosphaera sp.]|nr:PIN domain-containing protein [Crocosphaera sp.]
MPLSFIDTNVWLYLLFDDQRIEPNERERKRKIAKEITQEGNLAISTQVINELSVNLLKKASFQEEEVKQVIESLYNRCQVISFDLILLKSASNLRLQYQFSFWDSLIIASALSANAEIIYSEDMQDRLIIINKLTIVNPFKR